MAEPSGARFTTARPGGRRLAGGAPPPILKRKQMSYPIERTRMIRIREKMAIGI